MTKTSFAIAILSAALAVPALAQTAAPAAASSDPIVAARAEQRAANSAYAQALIRLTPTAAPRWMRPWWPR